MELISLQPLWWLLAIVVLFLGWQFSLVDNELWKRATSFVLRVVAVILLILALCRPFSFSTSDDLHVIFLVDVSQSIELSEALQATEEIEAALEQLRRNDSYSIYAFGSESRAFDSPQALGDWVRSWDEAGADDRFRNATEISNTLLKTRMQFPAGKVKRMVVFSDGQDTDGFLPKSIRQLTQEDVELSFRRIKSLTKAEAAVVGLEPSTPKAFIGEVVRMAVDVSSNQPIDGNLRLVHRGVVVQEQTVKLSGDRVDQFFFDVEMNTPGNSKWTAELAVKDDYFPINNQRTGTVTVRGKPRILILHEDEKEMRAFARALEKQDVMVEVRGQFGMPDSLKGLIAFDAIVLSDFPATAMTPRQMEMLKRYVKDFGGGLAMFGSENSFGLGGYHRTPVEEVMPLISRFEKEKEKPSLAMVLVIDKSGSMSGLPMALARQASKAAVELLGPTDSIGVVGFDDQPLLVSEMRSATQSDATCSDIDTVDAGGGTNMYPAMVVAKEMLENAPAKIRHMICLSDGHTQQADHLTLTQAMTDSGITVSTVALGDADRQLLASISEVGRGRYYETQDPANVPQIFTKETMQASKSAIKEDLFGTVQTGDHVALAGFNQSDLPFTLGYVMTQAKPTAQVLLVAETGDPLLAVSRFGLGTGFAFTSDVTEKWGGEWLAWGDCGKFWGQIFRSMVRKSDGEGIQIEQHVVRDQWQLDIKRFDLAGNLQSKVDWELAAVDREGRLTQYEVAEVGLGRYQATIPVDSATNLTVRLRDKDSNKLKVLHYDRPYPVEYLLSNQLPEEIEKLPSADLDQLTADLKRQPSRQSIVHWFYIAALACLLVSTLLRRV
ncbi:MAG: VWA domain-containing protein [Planctomycetota bacterium]